MYKGANQNAQDAARRLRVSDLERGGVELSLEEQRASLVAKWKSLHDSIASGAIGDKQRKRIGKEMHEIQAQISAIRPKKKAPGVENHFIAVVRESVPPAQFRIWMHEAAQRLEAEAA